ncbi:MAG: hypothetical protein PUC37_09385 [Spirochaetales bacterium]|nr:hypothetical protein [Spirochaetales bacterium]
MFKTSAKKFFQAGSAVLIAAVLTLFSSCGEKHTPESLFKDTIKHEVKEFSNSDFAKAYSQILNQKNTNVSGDVSLKFELGSGLKPLLRTYSNFIGIDLTFLKDINLDYSINLKDTLMNMGINLKVNDTKIVSGDIILDEASNSLFFKIPELINKDFFMQGDGVTDFSDAFRTSMNKSYELIGMLPSKETIDGLIDEILEALLSEIKDVQESDITVTTETKFGKVSSDCKELILEVDSDMAEAMIQNFSTTLKNSKNLDKLCKTVADILNKEANGYYSYTVDEVKDELVDALEYAVENILDYEPTITLYADTSKNLHGFEIEIDGDTLTVLAPETKNAFGIEVSFTDSYYDETYTFLSGYGTKSGNKITSDIEISSEEETLFEISTKDLAFTNTGFVGTLVLMPKQGLINSFRNMFYYSSMSSVISYLSDSKITFIGEQASKDFIKGKMIFADEYDTDYFTVYMTEKINKNANVKVPKKTDDMIDISDMEYYDIEDILYDIKLDEIAANLEKAGFPEEITSEIADMDGEDLFDAIGSL